MTIVFIREGPGSEYVATEGDACLILRKGVGLLGPLWGFITNIAHDVRYKGAKPVEGALDLDTLLFGALRVARMKPAVLICEDQFSAIVGYIVRKLLGTPYFVYFHEAPYEDPSRDMIHLTSRGQNRVQRLARIIDQIVMPGASGVFANTCATMDAVRRAGIHQFGTVIRPGVEVVSPVRRTSDEDLILSVSTWDAGRHPELYLKVAELLGRGEFVLAGMWRYGFELELNRFRELVSRSSARNRFTVTGRISATELTTYYSRARVFLRFGIDERGPGLGCIEAMAAGLPVIANKQLGIAELLRNGENGILLQSANPGEAAEAIRELLRNPDLQARLAAGALQTARSLSWRAHATTIAKVISDASILGGR